MTAQDTQIPEDIMQAARERADSIIGRMCLTMDHSFGLQSEKEQRGLRTSMSQLAEHDIAPAIARAILAERQRCAAPSTGIDFQRIPPLTPVQKVGGYPFTGTVVAAFQTLTGNERFVVEATGAEYAGMLHIFNGGQLRAAPKGKPE